MNKKDYRAVMGAKLREFRESRNLTAYAVSKKGNIGITQVKDVESGRSNYTIDIFLGYILGCDLYMYFAEKEENRELPHDFKDMNQKGEENYPR